MVVRAHAHASVASIVAILAIAASPACGSDGGTPPAASSSASDAGGNASSRDAAASADTAPPDAARPGMGAAPDAAAGTDASGPNGESGVSPAALQVTLSTLDTRQYVSATGGGGSTVTATVATAGASETFALTDATSATLTDGDTIQLAASNGDFLSASGVDAGGNLTADAVTAGADETFVIHRIAGPGAIHTGDLVDLETTGMSYVSATNGGGASVEANAPWAKGWESFWISIAGSPAPVNAQKQKVLSFLGSIDGKQTVAGQHDKNNPTPTDATDQVTSITGLAPGLWSADFGFGADDVAARPTMIAQAQTEWGLGSIVQLMYHACSPTGDEDCTWDDIGGATPASLTDAQWTDLVTDGGTLNAAWKARLDALSVFFAQLKAAGVAPFFRPEHEMNQGVFWWGGRPGPQGTLRLYQITHDYLVGNYGFDNIIWVWDVQDFSTLSTDVVSYDPGPDYYDIAALDVYDGGYDQSKYTTMQGAAGGKPIAVGECETPPTSAELTQQPDWVFFMLWPDYVTMDASLLPPLYSASNVITLGGMPGW